VRAVVFFATRLLFLIGRLIVGEGRTNASLAFAQLAV
jgi:hypothetical protein